MPDFSVKSLSVRQLFTWFDEAKFAVPEIQREFVWNTARACAFIDSLYKGYPVGTAMVWKAGKGDIHLLLHDLHVLQRPDPASQSPFIKFLQRAGRASSSISRSRRGRRSNRPSTRRPRSIFLKSDDTS